MAAIVHLEAAASIRFDELGGRSVLFYVIRGRVEIAGTEVHAFHLAELGPGDELSVRAAEDSLILFGHADPIGEPIVSYGPFVMNTRQEIQQAIADYQAGLFGEMAD